MIGPTTYGVSFSLKQCRAFNIDPSDTLAWLLKQGWRRFRLMSYWDEHEKQPGTYDFGALDAQIRQIHAAGGVVTLCLGARQPRWPENHWPDWAWKTSKAKRTTALLQYLQTVVERYKSESCIISYQLENEALLQSFGRRAEIDRKRLRAEFALVKRLDPKRPIIMSTSNSWGIPLRRPLPDIVGFSYYHTVWNRKLSRYTTAGHHTLIHRIRATLIRVLLQRRSFIHELQCEPWGPKAIWEMSTTEQDKSMSIAQIHTSLAAAQSLAIYPVDLWGAEWWYWRSKHGDSTISMAVLDSIRP